MMKSTPNLIFLGLIPRSDSTVFDPELRPKGARRSFVGAMPVPHCGGQRQVAMPATNEY